MDFNKFSMAVFHNWKRMQESNNVFQGCEGDALWAQYLASFPEGTNPVYIKNTEHDCACCRNFVKNIGTAVTIDKNGNKVTVWDCLHVPQPYAAVAEAMAAWLKQQTIVSKWVRKESQFGAEKTRQAREDGTYKTWTHFHGVVEKRHRSDTPDAVRGTFNTSRDVLARSLDLLTDSALDDVLDLIKDGALYRGQEFKKAVEEFKTFKTKYGIAASKDVMLNAWATNLGIAHFKNSVIGTLVEDISTGKPLEDAVKMFESKVAPSNYKRTSQLVTPKMIEQAMQTIKAEGLEPAMQRRGLRMEDLQVTNLLWAGQAAELPKSPLEAMLFASAKTSYKASKGGDTMSLTTFLTEILPRSSKLELVLKNHQTGNLMALTTGAEDPKLFKWDNPVAWSYNGEMTDSAMQKAVAAKGGRLDGVFRFTHSWNHSKRNASLMDLHVFLPSHTGGRPEKCHDFYGNHNRVGWNNRNHNATGGTQDVDYTNPAPVGYVPVENITFPDLRRMPEGVYQCKVHNWAFRKPTEGGFKAEIAFEGKVYEYQYDSPLQDKEWVDVASVTLKDGKFSIKHHIQPASEPVEVWGIKTLTPIAVKAVMKSPNHWAGEVGNLHWMFLLDGALNPNPVRGFYNEFLRSDLEKHRKVLDLAGSKSLVQLKQGDLCGAGFSSTKPEVITLIATTEDGRREYQVQV